MDSLTQITLGAAVGEAVLGKKIGNKAIIWGAVAGLIPDLDVIPSQFMNAVERVDFHRSISHSLLFFIMLTPLLSLLARKIHKSIHHISFREWGLLFFLSLFTHSLLDCFTTWGTQLFWPLEYRVAFQSVFVIDPIYTLPLLIGLLGAAFKRQGSQSRKRWNKIGLIISSAYLLLTLLNKQFIHHQFKTGLKEQSIKFKDIDTRPSPLNNILWSANAETKKGFYLSYYSLFDNQRPDQFKFYPKNHELLTSQMRSKPIIQKLLTITQGEYIVENGKADNTLVIHDLRFGQLAGWLPKTNFPEANNFVFSYKINKKLLLNSQKPAISRPEPSIDKAAQIFPKLWKRLKGIEK